MPLSDLLSSLRADPTFMANVSAWRTLSAQAGQFAPIPARLQAGVRQALHTQGIDQLYSHQTDAIDQSLTGHNVVIATPTASGKTLCYTLPVLDRLLSEPQARALYLFPTKALAHDQLDELGTWRAALPPGSVSLTFAAYDGDTPSAERARLRKTSRIILTNPDMLHSSILPYHTQWREFLSGLRYVVIDEVHTYRGVFGSQVANVLRRLQRLCRFYGSQPQFICTSATIANPGRLAEQLIEQPVSVIDQNGAPRGEKHILLYNPPIYDAEQGLRRSALLESEELAARCVVGGMQTIVFGRARRTVELLLTYLRDRLAQSPNFASPTLHSALRGYRGGYLPSDRRAIEAGLRSGEVRAVVTTNALELGIDIGQLQAAILCGYPGSIASLWQQIGRAGRSQEAALAILVATGVALDQFLMQQPEYLFDRSPEQAIINPDNLMLLIDQVRCAAFELPFQAQETLGSSHHTHEVLQVLTEQGDLRAHNNRFLWSGDAYPARQVNLRSTGGDPVVIQAEGLLDRVPGSASDPDRAPRILGEMDVAGAMRMIHEGAIYLHEGESYRVEQLDVEKRLASVVPLRVDYYTDPIVDSQIEVLATHDEKRATGVQVAHGEVRVQTQLTGYRRIKRQSHEMLGVYPLAYPPQVVETSGYWFCIAESVQRDLAQRGLWFDSLNDYGPNWSAQRQRVRQRDDYRCTQCGTPEPPDREHDVHHVRPFRTFGYVAGINEHYLVANQLSNLLLVCRNCHQRLESGVRTRGALDGLGYALNQIAPLHIMCDPSDIGIFVERQAWNKAATQQVITPNPTTPDLDFYDSALSTPHSPFSTLHSPFDKLPTIYVYERVAAGLGFSLRLYELHEELMASVQRLIRGCGCRLGCPGCVGPVLDSPLAQLETKRLTLALVALLHQT